jgi:hypothetical protein
VVVIVPMIVRMTMGVRVMVVFVVCHAGEFTKAIASMKGISSTVRRNNRRGVWKKCQRAQA